MPTDSDPKTPSDSQKPRQGWLATKCGPLLSALSVRGRHASEEDPNRPVMRSANSRDKKRKRTSSPTSTRLPLKLEKSSVDNMTGLSSRDVFRSKLIDPNVRKSYDDARDKLWQAELMNAWDRGVRPEEGSLSNEDKIELQAEIIIRELREYERRVVFGNVASEAIPPSETRDMGGQFLTNKDRIEQESKIYELAKRVPKGALLHLHFNAELHPERLLLEARKSINQEHMYIRSIRPLLDQEDLDLTEMVFNYMRKTTKSNDIFSPQYEGNSENHKPQYEMEQKIWMRWDEFRKRFEDKFPGKYKQSATDVMNGLPKDVEPGKIKLKPAENWIKQKMVLSPEEAYGEKQTVNGVWARFNQATRCFKGLLNYERVYKWYIGEAIERMIQEKVMYAELRPMLLDKAIPDDYGNWKKDGSEGINNPAQMQLIIDGYLEKKAQLKSEGREDDFPFCPKIIYCTPRSIPPEFMRKEMEECIALKEKYPDLICGFDLVGAEDRPNSIGFYGTELAAFEETCKLKNLDIPFLFHAGETLLDTGGSTDPKNSNLIDAVRDNSKRVGHGFALMKHPTLVEKYKLKDIIDPHTKEKKGVVKGSGICIELCPISNELLHLCRNIKEHPYPELLAAGIPCTVNSDNPSLFSNSMSHEFYQIMVGCPTMSLYSWKQLALWSLEYSCLSPVEKEKAESIWRTQWREFCQLVVKDYGDLVPGGSLDEPKAKVAYEDMKASRKP